MSRILLSISSNLNGFSMKSNAPSLNRLDGIFTDPNDVMTITAVDGCNARAVRKTSRPLPAGHLEIGEDDVEGAGVSAAIAAFAIRRFFNFVARFHPDCGPATVGWRPHRQR